MPWILLRVRAPRTFCAGIQNAGAIIAGKMPADQLAVHALDDYTLEIRLTRPVPYFLDILTNTIASPVHASSLAGAAGFSRPTTTVAQIGPPIALSR
ncbi:MAG: hypothetical protein HC814_04540 [Rhodobacteraceae bacterium]|nr:hypothetical protein [Paracoccaceae bacterium]